jgi:hypothetical protein
MERIREQDERSVGSARFGCGQRRNAAAKRMATDHDVRLARDDLVERGDGLLGLALWEVDRCRIDTTGKQAVDEGCHAGTRPRGAVPEIAVERHIAA